MPEHECHGVGGSRRGAGMSCSRTALAIGVMVLVLGPGCASMTKRYDDLTGKSDQAKQSTVELNTAGRKQLAALPGLTADDADRIIAKRPYTKARDLVSKGALSESKFDKIRGDVYVDHGKS